MSVRREEETIARDLHRALAGAIPDARIAIRGLGVHWDCEVGRGPHAARTSCFFTGLPPHGTGPEYAIDFRLDGQEAARGRTLLLDEAVAAMRVWLEGGGIEELHRRFAFVDRHQRALHAIREAAERARPALGRLISSLERPPYGPFHELRYRAEDRGCVLSYYGRNAAPDAVFDWDECAMIRIRVDDAARLATALDRWLCERATPSAMVAEFPGAEVFPVAKFYEEGRPIEGEFLLSWDGVERLYLMPTAPPGIEAVREMIAAMRRAGYDRTLRAGTSVWRLILSRSRRYGLRPGQPRLLVQFDADGGVEILSNLDGRDRPIAFPTVRFTLRVEALLHELSTRDVD